MRLFAALLPPPRAAGELTAALRELRGLPGAALLGWSDPPGWHITLAFYGETPPELLPGLGERLVAVAGDHEPFPLRLAGGGTFGDRVLWAGVGGERDALARLAGAAVEAGEAAGAPGGYRHPAYVPHLTLAYSRDEVALAPYAAALAGFGGTAWRAGSLVLMRSESEEGYATQAAWPLGVP